MSSIENSNKHSLSSDPLEHAFDRCSSIPELELQGIISRTDSISGGYVEMAFRKREIYTAEDTSIIAIYERAINTARSNPDATRPIQLRLTPHVSDAVLEVLLDRCQEPQFDGHFLDKALCVGGNGSYFPKVTDVFLMKIIAKMDVIPQDQLERALRREHSNEVVQQLIAKCPNVDDNALNWGVMRNYNDLIVSMLLAKVTSPITLETLRRASMRNYSEETFQALLLRSIELDETVDTDTCMYGVLYGRFKAAEQNGEIYDQAPSGRHGDDDGNTKLVAYSDKLIALFLNQAKQVDANIAEQILCLNLSKPLIAMALRKATKKNNSFRASIFVPRLIKLNDAELFDLYLNQGGVIDSPMSYFFSAFTRRCHERIILALCDSLESRGEIGVRLINDDDLRTLDKSGYSPHVAQRIRQVMGLQDHFCRIM